MKRTHALLAVAIGTALIVGATAFAASGEATALKQRIAIDIVRNKVTGTKPDNGTFTLYAVDEFAGRPGALETDEGTMTWKIVKGTGAYAGFKGGGRHVSVRMPNGRTIVRQEGWVTG